jgi:hypothetical protein
MPLDYLKIDEICVGRPYLAFFFVGVMEFEIRPPGELFKNNEY